MARPMPSPPDVPDVRSTCENMSKMLGSALRGMPTPVSWTTIRTSVVAFGDERDPPARRRVLGAVDEEVAQHLRDAGQVGVEDDRLGGQTHRQLMTGGFNGWPR